MIRKLIHIFILILIVEGCSLVHFLSTSDPTNEMKMEYNIFLQKLGADTSFSFQIRSDYFDSLSKSYKYCLNLYKFNKHTNASPVQIRMYDHQGRITSGWEQCYGELHYFHLFDSVPLRRIKHHPTNYTLQLQNDLDLISTSSLQRDKIEKYVSSHDFTIILFYADWAGWYSRDAIKRTLKYIGRNKNIALIFLNTACK